jgi:HAD superfamily hydrolase (TIGR01509 family)
MTVQAVTFDLWLTLIWDSRELEEYRRLRRLVNFYRYVNKYHRGRGIEQSSTSRFTFNDVRLALEELGEEVKQDYERGEDIHPKERARRLFRKLKIEVDEEEVYERAGVILSNSGYMKKFPHINPEARPALRAIKKKFPRVKIALISNAARSTATYMRTLKALGVSDYFDHFTISCEVGYLKPRREIFEHALNSIGAAPEKSVHVGDLFKADIVGAAACGMNACLYTGLWKKYAQYGANKVTNYGRKKGSFLDAGGVSRPDQKLGNPSTTLPDWVGERIPKDFKTPSGLFVKEIDNLKEVVEIAGRL